MPSNRLRFTPLKSALIELLHILLLQFFIVHRTPSDRAADAIRLDGVRNLIGRRSLHDEKTSTLTMQNINIQPRKHQRK